ncbi:MAG: TetR/AcrR family transcriptional regulator [Novosphingobium sp.]|nr:TetR/AcrR family transcriptional regulator [Novosphingobium sp.]MCP5402123.1 TetR/AcrR family transcriptional regulator [Novosphingobium sp.]
MIETAVRMISENGAGALSIAALAREMGINRTTVYYHFDSRDALLDAVTDWASSELAKGMDMDVPAPERAGNITRFVLENPELIKLWIDDFVSGDDIRDSYPRWDGLVEGVRGLFAEQQPDEEVDAEVYCVMMLAGAIIGARVFANSVSQGASVDETVERFLKEHRRIMTRDGLEL